uniref:YidH family protein n=1 Tax=Thaumasiovibrio occultus TaxID=1891184 RepID=UPI000B35CEF7|nr:DUF202 domain-containing protein [Thaumasiovibrio occultus]
MSWRRQGKAPDYRFSLANERTFLAWIRTALALLAGAVGIDQLTPDLADPLIRLALCSALSLFAAFMAFFAYKRWSANEKAMRLGQDLSYSGLVRVVSLLIFLLCLSITVVILMS